jgi:three-Cys-motif partner protein
VERAEDNIEALRAEVRALGTMPERVFVDIFPGDAFEHLERLLQHFDASGSRMAPAFIFVDPYGFKVPGSVLRRLLAAGRVELFVNVIWRELDMAIAQARSQDSGGMVETLDSVFDGDEWRTRIVPEGLLDERADQAVDLLRERYGARWATTVRMLATNDQTRYMLVHFSNHEDGRDLMKDAIWKVCPDGGYQARRSDNPNQTMLIVPEPNLAPLEEWVVSALAYRPLRWSELTVRVRAELWRSTHLNDTIRALRRSGRINASEFEGRFSERADPLLSITQPGGAEAPPAE